VRKTFAITCLLFAWLCANGALLDVVQVVAWGKMFSAYSKTMPVTAALRETFDPTKPCEMCIGVAAAKEDLGQKNVPLTTEQGSNKLVLAFHRATPVILLKVSEEWPAALARTASVRSEPVPVPPPRA
jgi:hypothetical protein